MEAREIIRLINSKVHYKPGWEVEAELHWLGSPLVNVTLNVRVENSDAKYAPEYKGNITYTGLSDRLNAFDIHSEEELARWVFEHLIMRQEAHENREFFGWHDDENYTQKPFHPHTFDGNNTWRNTAHMALTDVEASSAFVG